MPLKLKRTFHSENLSYVFRPHYARGVKKRTNHRTFEICSKKTSVRDIIRFSLHQLFRIARVLFQNVFSPHENEKRAFSNSSGLNSVFENLGFRDGRISVDVRLNRRNEASFSNFSGVLWTGAIALIVFQRFSDKCRR